MDGIIADHPTIAELERRYLDVILRETGGNKTRAAKILGIDRRTLYRVLERENRAGMQEIKREHDCKSKSHDNE
jgi:DNA-binding NtrC family response regulator